MSFDTSRKAKASASHGQGKPIPRVLELNLSLPGDLAFELDRLSVRGGMFLDEVVARILEAARSRSRRILLREPLATRPPSPDAPVSLTVPITRNLYYHLLKRSRVSGRSMEELAVRTLQSTQAIENAVAPAIEALRQLYLARCSEVEEEKAQSAGPALEPVPPPTVLGAATL